LTPPIIYETASSIVRGPPSPFIVVEIHGVPIKMDRGHALAQHITSHPLYDSEIGYIVKHLRDRASRPITAVDVGANIGDTACLAARMVSKDDVEFICIEASEDFLELLRENTSNLRVEIVHAIAGETTSTATKQVVTLNIGTSFIDDGGSSYETTIDSIVRGRQIDLIKIDTDGYEMEVIRGSVETIARCKPALFLEYAPHHIRTYGKTEPRDILKELSSMGYGDALAYDNLGHVIGVLPLLGDAMDVLTTYSESRNGFYIDLFLSKDEASIRSLAESETLRTNTATVSGY
jgi:FkbM family methyltransferase